MSKGAIVIDKFYRRLVLTNIIVGCLYFITSIAIACEIKVRAYEYPPKFIKTSSGEWIGHDVDVIQKIGEQVNCRIHFVEVPWARALVLLEQNEIDAVMNVSLTPERAEKFYFSNAYDVEKMTLIVRNEYTKLINELHDLTNIEGKVAIERGVYLGEEFKVALENDALFASKILMVTGNDQKIALLKRGRVFGVFEDLVMAKYHQEKNSWFAEFTILPLVINENYTYIALSKKNITPALFAKINQAIDQLNFGKFDD